MNRFALVLVCLGASAGCGGCDADALQVLHAELVLAPAELDVFAWVGHDATASFTVANRGRAPLEVTAAALDADELDAALGVSLDLERALLAPGASARVDVVVRAAAPATVGLLLRVVTLDRQVRTALLHVKARAPPPCTPLNVCETATFDPVLGACIRGTRPEGAACDDASACTDEDRCSGGACVGRAVTCVDDVDCTVDACDPTRGCVFQPVNELCADDNPCTADVCNPALAGAGCRSTTSPDGTPCGPFSCAQLSTCILGSCFTAPTPDGFPCEDGDLCTQGDVCHGQQCEPGDDVEPTAAAPVLLARPVVHVDNDLRWYAVEPIDVEAPSFDVTPAFDVVLDIAQGLVGARPTLAVLWRTVSFNVSGQPCAPWDMWATSALEPTSPASFCASAVVVTFVDEAELAQATDAVGDSVVLDVIYGTASGAFGPRASVTSDELRVLIAESTYAPSPDSGRELHVERMTLSLDARAVIERETEYLYSGPRSAVETNVHAGLRVALDDVDDAIVGWDLPMIESFESECDTDDECGPGSHCELRCGHPPPSCDDCDAPCPALCVQDDPDCASICDTGSDEPCTCWLPDGPAPTVVARLDLGVIVPHPSGEMGSVTWGALLEDACFAGPPPAVEELAWRDVDVARANGETYMVVRHNELATDGTGAAADGCGEWYGPSLLTGIVVGADGTALVTPIGDGVASSLGRGAGVLARIVVWPACDAGDVDDMCEWGCTPGEDDGECFSTWLAPYALEIQPAPFDQFDPVVTLRRAFIGVPDFIPGRVASLDVDAGVFGAVVAERGVYDGLVRLRLVDDVSAEGVGTAAVALSSEPFTAPDATVRALRSPLSPQRVYAVTTLSCGDDGDTEANEGVVVRFGCSFPTPP